MILGGIILVGIGYYLYELALNSKHRISSEEAKTLIQNGSIDLIFDVRTDIERRTLGFYPGSVHIESADLEKEMPNRHPNKSIKILVYCNTGHRARLATDKLHKMGYSNSVYISSGHTSIL